MRMASLTIVRTTETSVTAKVTGFSSYSYQRTVYIDAYLGDEKVATKSKTVNANVSDSGNITVSGLDSGTTYRIECFVYLHGDESTVYIGSKNAKTQTPTPTVALWDWNASNGEASASQTKKAYDAVSNKGYVSDFNYNVWNDLVEKVSEARVAYGTDEWNNNYGANKSSTKASSGVALTAKRYNSLKNNLGSIYSTGIADVSKDDPVIGQTHFLNFTTKLNEFINSL